MVHRARDLSPHKLLNLLMKLDALRRPDRFGEILLACEIDATGRTGKTGEPYPSADYLRRARATVSAVDTRNATGGGLSGDALRTEIDRVRVNALQNSHEDQTAR